MNVVRKWCYYDGWFDVFGPDTEEKCLEFYNGKTNNGRRFTADSPNSYKEGHYKVFPADTKMLWSSKELDR